MMRNRNQLAPEHRSVQKKPLVELNTNPIQESTSDAKVEPWYLKFQVHPALCKRFPLGAGSIDFKSRIVKAGDGKNTSPFDIKAPNNSKNSNNQTKMFGRVSYVHGTSPIVPSTMIAHPNVVGKQKLIISTPKNLITKSIPAIKPIPGKLPKTHVSYSGADPMRPVSIIRNAHIPIKVPDVTSEVEREIEIKGRAAPREMPSLE